MSQSRFTDSSGFSTVFFTSVPAFLFRGLDVVIPKLTFRLILKQIVKIGGIALENIKYKARIQVSDLSTLGTHGST